MPKNSTVGIDINCVSYEEYISIKNELGMNNINLVATENNLVDKIWTDKPASVISEISIFLMNTMVALVLKKAAYCSDFKG